MKKSDLDSHMEKFHDLTEEFEGNASGNILLESKETPKQS